LTDVDLAGRVARLSAGQRACLDLVDDHATSKEIARQLDISRHTVDARLRGAIQTLGVSSRREAAIIYRAAMQAQTYQSFTYQPPRIVAAAPQAEKQPQEQFCGDFEDDLEDALPDMQQRIGGASRQPAAAYVADSASFVADNSAIVADSAVWTGSSFAHVRSPRPFLRLWGGANDLSPTQRMIGILVVMILAMLAFGVLLSGIEALTLLRS
jgi:DNA-binding CsgD family transcriptional regulator